MALTPSIDFDETAFGAIQYITMPEPWIFFVETNKDTYYVLPQAQIGSIVSHRAAAYGIAHGNLFYFDYEHGRDIVEYELLQSQLASSYGMEKQLLKDKLALLKTYGKKDFPDYFGAFPPPNDTPWGKTCENAAVSNGVFFLKTDQGKWVLSVCYPVWQEYLSEEVILLGKRQSAPETPYSEYFFDQNGYSAAIFELKEWFPQIGGYITSFSALLADLGHRFPNYIEKHNQEVRKMHEVLEQPRAVCCAESIHSTSTELIFPPAWVGEPVLNL